MNSLIQRHKDLFFKNEGTHNLSTRRLGNTTLWFAVVPRNLSRSSFQ
uniref:Uncharacterized protein n=1 Tax=Ciona intestinalis TaxID=7719 RepID=H2Y3T1_CIOIN